MLSRVCDAPACYKRRVMFGRSLRPGSLSAWGAIALFGCALDERPLNAVDSLCTASGDCSSQGGGGLSGAAGRSAAGRGGVGGIAGAAAQGGAHAGGSDTTHAGSAGDGAGGILVGPNVTCPDLNQNAVADCLESLAQNPSFDKDVKGWAPEANGAIYWDALDGQGSNKSGTMRVENRAPTPSDGIVYSGATECVPIEANHAYDIYVQMYSRGPIITGYGSVLGRIFASPDCSGSALLVKTSELQATVDQWLTLLATVPATTGAQSLLVELSVGKLSTSSGNVNLVFDNVLVR